MFLQTNDIFSKRYLEDLGYKCINEEECSNLNPMYIFENDKDFKFNEDLYNFKISRSNIIKFEANVNPYVIDTEFEDPRFIKLRLDLQHDSVNKNFTEFDLQDIIRAAPTLKNIPIVANVKFDKFTGEPYFGSHDRIMERDKTKPYAYRTIYKETPIGVLPSDLNELSYEVKEFEDKNHIYVNGLIFSGFSNYAEDIILRDETVNLSMEIEILDYLYNPDTGIRKVTDYFYRAITLLGDDHLPAMDFSEATIRKEKKY